MNLVRYSVVIKNFSHFGNKVVTKPFYPAMWAEAEVTCPCCGKSYEISTQKNPLGGPNPPAYTLFLHRAIQEIVETKECHFCGVDFSPVPKSVRDEFVKNVFTTYSTNWADAEIAKLREQAEEPDTVK